MSAQGKISASLEKIAANLLAFVHSQPSAVTEKQIGRSVRGRKQARVKALRLLVGEGKIIRGGRGHKSSPFMYSANTGGGPSGNEARVVEEFWV